MIYESDPNGVVRWMQSHDSHVAPSGEWHALGCVLDGRLIAGVVYDNYDGNSLWMSIIATDPRWCLPGNLEGIFGYPFLVAKVNRVSTLTSVQNIRSIRLQRGLGYRAEGILRQGFFDGTDAVVMGMTKPDCRWIGEKNG